MTPDDDADSLLRAVAAAPAVTPARTITAMVVRASAAAPIADQWSLIRARAADRGVDVDEHGRDLRALVWRGADHAERAAACALELRDALPEAAIALATAALHPTDAATAVIERAASLLDTTGKTIRIDDDTARRLESAFMVQAVTGGSELVLVEPRPTGTPARLQQTIGNYRIVSLLGTGGMGVVYLAEHVSLARKAVIKFVHERLSATDEFSARFFTEAKTAASIRHPGIVDVFDYGQDERGHSYIVMEYLDGESLRARLRREHPLRIDVALAIAGQVASALAAAHDAGVIHRDLKPDNIFLVRDPESPHRVRAKVLDFGLAKQTAPTERGLTRTGDFVGTPLYMSPEQCRGRDVDHRTDIYSLGCIVFEMMCGQAPFLDETVGELIIAHNSTPPPMPRSLKPELPRAIERVILRALAKAPVDRYATMAELGAALAEAPAGSGVGLDDTAVARPAAATPAGRRARRRRLVITGVAAAAMALAAAAVIALVMSRASVPARSAAATPAPSGRSIAWIDLRNTSGRPEDAWLATAIGELVTTELAQSDQLRVAPPSDVARMKTDLGLGDVADVEPDQLDKIRADIGADYVIAGSYDDTSGQLRVAVKLYDTRTHRVATEARADGADTELGGVGSRVASELERVLGVRADALAAPAGEVLPAGTAARSYAEGLAMLRRYDLVGARDVLVHAASQDPSDPLIHSALASTWQQLGYEANAAAEAKLAYDHAAALPKEQRLAIEAKYRETTAQWDQAIESYRTLFEFFPTRLEYGLELAAAQTHAGDVKGAYGTLDGLRKMPQLGNDPRIELAEAAAAEEADDMERERAHAERAVTLARKRGARVLLAQASLRYGWALWTLGRDADAKTAYEEAQRIFAEQNDRSGLARCLNNIALAAHRDRRDADAASAFDRALELATASGDTTAQAWVLNNWAYMLTDEGDLTRALVLYNRKLELGGARGDAPSSQAAAQANIAEISRWHGDLAGARHHAEIAQDLLRGLDARRFAAFTAYQLGEIERAEDDLDGSQKRLQQALGWASDVMTPAETAEIRVSLARTEIDAGRAGDADALARAALDDLRAAKDTSQTVCATAVLASALVAENRVADASRELAVIGDRPDGVSFACRLEAELARAATTAADPAQRAAAIAALHAAGERATKSGFVQRELEIRLASARLGADTPGDVARAAAAKGFKQIARRAMALAKK